ncbi:hypothetical protein FOZ63_003829 [Perkinsus olseni]|uniref:Uncharacterized protein n=1 Tax=Perkinsus olseni TaxID=32597 RepID=A0A7J6TH22_PEROL|nr:hypothetical protein FOZ63_003829 [Perkinsus olseni]
MGNAVMNPEDSAQTIIAIRRALHHAGARGRVPPARSQTSPGLKGPSQAPTGGNPLWRAVLEDDAETLQSLLVGDLPDTSSSSDAIVAVVNAKNRSGETLLTFAAKHSSRKCVQVLTRMGCNVNAQDSSGRTAFLVACAKDNIDIAKDLFHRASCDPDIADDGGFTGFALAVVFGNVEIVRWWLTAVSRSAATDEIPGLLTSTSWRPFLLAAHLGRIEMVQTIAKFIGKVSLNGKDSDGRGVLYLAASAGNLKMAEFVLSLGVDRSQLTEPAANGMTPLWVASCGGHLEFVRWLLEVTDADESAVDRVDSRGASPLYIAVENGHVGVVECLIQHGADVNRTPYQTCSPAVRACVEGNLVMLQTLMKTGMVNRNDKMMVVAARFNGNEDIVVWVQSTRGYFTALHYARELTFDQVLAHLRGADPRQSNIRARIPISHSGLLGPSSLSLARQCVDTPLDDDRLELIRRAAEVWSPATHWLFDSKARKFAVLLARVGRRLACPSHRHQCGLSSRPLPFDIWSMHIMPMTITRTQFQLSEEEHRSWLHPNFDSHT